MANQAPQDVAVVLPPEPVQVPEGDREDLANVPPADEPAVEKR